MLRKLKTPNKTDLQKCSKQDIAQEYLADLVGLEKEFGLNLRYLQVKREGEVYFVERQLYPKEDPNNGEGQRRLFTDSEWNLLQAAKHLRRQGSEQDYDLAVEVTEGVYAGRFR